VAVMRRAVVPVVSFQPSTHDSVDCVDSFEGTAYVTDWVGTGSVAS